METSKKQQYLKYFGEKTSAAPTPKYRLSKQCRRYEQSKMLPHIPEQYNFRVTNHLLVNKIINPKRDKIIMNSMELVYKKSNSGGNFAESFRASRRKWRSSQKDRKQLNNSVIKRQKPERKVYVSQPSEHISVCQEKTDSIIIRRNSKQSFTKTEKINFYKLSHNSIMENQIQDGQNTTPVELLQPERFHAKTFYKAKSHQNSLHFTHQTSFVNPPGGFGCGPTIIKITHLSIAMNPALKVQTLLQLQLIQRPALSLPFKNISNEKEQRAIRTIPISYQDLLTAEANGGVKFAVKISKIGDFVPLRIWKCVGVECLELGTIDLPLSLYKQKKNDDEQTAQKIKWQMKQGQQNMGRAVLQGQVSCHLRTAKMVEIDAKAYIKYKIYPKKYNKLISRQQ